MNELIERISICIESGKVDKASSYPPNMKGVIGADELTKQALEEHFEPGEILNACNIGMHKIGEKFSRKEVFVPQLLMSAKAMNAVMVHLKPFFQSGNVKKKGKFILGTVAGDLHNIGKNLVAMVVEGNGWEVIDLGVDVQPAKFVEAIKNNPDAAVGLSALLTTTIESMYKTVKAIKAEYPKTNVIVGGAPLSLQTAEKMGADAYAPNPQGAVDFLQRLSA